jgi:hypothetical protein
MKILSVIIGLLFLLGCSNILTHPIYKVGDCYINTDDDVCEKWQDCEIRLHKVLEVGIEHYLLDAYSLHSKDHSLSYKYAVTLSIVGQDYLTKKIDCPIELR